MSAPVFMYEKQKNAKTCTGSCLQPAFTADSVGEDFWTVNILQFKQIRRAGAGELSPRKRPLFCKIYYNREIKTKRKIGLCKGIT